MGNLLKKYEEKHIIEDLVSFKTGDAVTVFTYKDGDKTKTQAFSGIVIGCNSINSLGGTMTVRKIVDGVGVEKTFPINSPNIDKIVVDRECAFTKAKLYYKRKKKGALQIKIKKINKSSVNQNIAEEDKNINSDN